MTLQLTQETIANFYNSDNEFPISFDDTFEWLGYTRKDSALRAFDKCQFIENIDYLVLLNFNQKSKGRPSKDYFLSSDCFKHFSMMFKRENGRLIRNYFIQCEKTKLEKQLKKMEIELNLKTIENEKLNHILTKTIEEKIDLELDLEVPCLKNKIESLENECVKKQKIIYEKENNIRNLEKEISKKDKLILQLQKQQKQPKIITLEQ